MSLLILAFCSNLLLGAASKLLIGLNGRLLKKNRPPQLVFFLDLIFSIVSLLLFYLLSLKFNNGIISYQNTIAFILGYLAVSFFLK